MPQNDEQILTQYEPLLIKWSGWFYENNPTIGLERDDFYQEGAITILLANRLKSDKINAAYLTTSLKNTFLGMVYKASHIVSTSREAVELNQKINSLAAEGLSSEEITDTLGISHQRYLDVHALSRQERIDDVQL